MIRQLSSSFLAFLLTLVVLGGAAQPAAAGTVRYRAEPATPQERATLIARDLVWKCGAGACLAPAGNSRPAVECSALARQVGTLRSFTVDGRPLPPAELEKCNARAR